MHTNRYFANTFPDYNESSSTIIDKNGLLNNEIKSLIKKNFLRLFDEWESNYINNNSYKLSNDISVYTGITGAAILYVKIYESKIFPDSDGYLVKAEELIEFCLKKFNYNNNIRINVPTFLCGEIGFLTMAVLIYFYRNKNYDNLLAKILSIHPMVCNDVDLPNELLYGTSGYLYSLLLLRSKIKTIETTINDKLIEMIITSILKSGKKNAINLNSKLPLTYFWYNESYIGAAHGYLGILYYLLHCNQFISADEMNNFIKPTLNIIVDQQFKSGNFPASLNETDDKLIHWCHGSPGSIYALSLAYNIFNNQNNNDNENYLHAAIKCGDNIWEKGLLRKGYGLCHGVAGNAYSFLCLYRLTMDQKYLYRAIKFCEWCCHYGEHNGCRKPDTPYSLFEGMAGTLYFLIDLLTNHNDARFPAFQL